MNKQRALLLDFGRLPCAEGKKLQASGKVFMHIIQSLFIISFQKNWIICSKLINQSHTHEYK